MKPKILYKYRAVGEYTEKIFTDKTIWLSKPENLNDPFECSIANFTERVKEKITIQNRRNQVSSFIIHGYKSVLDKSPYFNMEGKSLKNFLKKLRSKSMERKYQMINEVVYNASGVPLSNPNQLFKSLEQRLKTTGIFSLSETDSNQLMWTHYANEHKGLALGFEVEPNSILADDRHCLAVNYSDKLPDFELEEFMSNMTITIGTDNKVQRNIEVPFDDPVFRRCVSTKSAEWNYEKEWRYIDETDGLHAFPGKLVEVTFGLRCTEENRLKIISLAKENFDDSIIFYEIVKVPNTSQIAKQRYNYPKLL